MDSLSLGSRLSVGVLFSEVPACVDLHFFSLCGCTLHFVEMSVFAEGETEASMITVHSDQARGKAVGRGMWAVSCSLLLFAPLPRAWPGTLPGEYVCRGWPWFSEAPDLLTVALGWPRHKPQAVCPASSLLFGSY